MHSPALWLKSIGELESQVYNNVLWYDFIMYLSPCKQRREVSDLYDILSKKRSFTSFQCIVFLYNCYSSSSPVINSVGDT